MYCVYRRTSNLPKTISSNAKPVDNTPKPPVINEDSSSQYDLADLVAMEYGKPNAVRVILDEEKNSQHSTENGDTSGNIAMLQLCKHETRS
jgi:hypothetical protein